MFSDKLRNKLLQMLLKNQTSDSINNSLATVGGRWVEEKKDLGLFIAHKISPLTHLPLGHILQSAAPGRSCVMVTMSRNH